MSPWLDLGFTSFRSVIHPSFGGLLDWDQNCRSGNPVPFDLAGRRCCAATPGRAAALSVTQQGVNTPWRTGCDTAHSHGMKHKKFPQHQNHKPASGSGLPATVDLNRSGIDIAPSADEVAERAYFNYMNQGALPGYEVKHWLEAEEQLLAERKLAHSN